MSAVPAVVPLTAIHYSRGCKTEDNTPTQRMAEDFDQFRDLVLSDQAAEKGKQWIAGPCATAPADELHIKGGHDGSFKRAIGKPHRCMACVRPRRFLSIDLDKVESDEALADLQGWLTFANVSAFGWTTHSHKPDKIRARFIIEADRDMDRDECMRASSALRNRINGALGGPEALDRFGFDDSMDRPEQPIYLPPKVGERWTYEGAPVCVDDLLESAPAPRKAPATVTGQAVTQFDSGQVIETERHAYIRKRTLMFAAAIKAGYATRADAIVALFAERDAGKYSRSVPDDEIVRALDGALAKMPERAANDSPAELTDPSTLTQALIEAMCPLSVQELRDAATPHAHAFQGGYRNKVGLFPIGEVTVIGAPGREGKTSMIVAIAQAYASGWTLGGLTPQPDRAVAIYSGEDDREQYARKLGGHYVRLVPAEAEQLRQSILIPDLHGELLGPVREIVTVNARVPTRGVIVESLVAAIRTNPRIGLVIVETASTVSAAEEDNAGHRVLISALKYVAKMTGTAVVLTHHTSQAAASKLPDLDVSEADIRGGTALVNNARQTFLPVSLGSTNDPHPDGDARTALRKLVAGATLDRVTVLICLSSSKSMDPPPIFFGWSIDEDYDPRLGEIKPPVSIAGKAWRAVRGLLAGARADQKADKKAEQGQANIRLVVKAVADISEKGEQATANKVSTTCGRNPAWAKPYLALAVEQGELVRSTEAVPRAVGLTDVYRVAGAVSIPWKSE